MSFLLESIEAIPKRLVVRSTGRGGEAIGT